MEEEAHHDPGSSPPPSRAPPRQLHWWLLPLLIVITLVSGTAVIILQKLMNQQEVTPCADCSPRVFSSPMWQTLVMFAGQSLALSVFMLDKWVVKLRGHHWQGHLEFPSTVDSSLKPPIPIWYWIIPAVLDALGSTLCNIAFTITFASTVQILRNSIVVMCALLQVTYLRRPLKMYEWCGVTLITIGMVATGLNAIINIDPSSQVTSSLSWLGIVLAIIGTAFTAFQMVMEEHLMRKYYASPVAAVGWQGVFGIFLVIGALVASSAMHVEDVRQTLYQIKTSGVLISANVLYFVGVALYNGASMSVTKLTGAVIKSMLLSVRSGCVWLVELALQWNVFDWLTVAGLVLLTYGLMVYNNAPLTGWAHVCDSVRDESLSLPDSSVCVKTFKSSEFAFAPAHQSKQTSC